MIPSPAELEELLQICWRDVTKERPNVIDTYTRSSSKIERAICFRFGVALDERIRKLRKDWTDPWNQVTVDSELHRAHDGDKLNANESPDLVVHVRGRDDANLLVLEVKHRSRPSQKDIDKLRRLAKDRGYRHAWALQIGSDSSLKIHPSRGRLSHSTPR